MNRAIIFLAAVATGLNVTAQIQIYDSGVWTDIRVAAQKANGQLTAAGTGNSWQAWNWNENWQPTYNNSPWNSWGSSDTAKGTIASMESLGTGIVVSLWDQKDDGTVFCMEHDAGSYAGRVRFAGLHGPASRTGVFVDSGTNFWITEAGLNICKASGTSHAYRQTPKVIHTIVVDELWPGGNVTNRLPVSITEDAHGRIWFWSNCLLGDDSRGAVHGVLICNDNVVTNLTVLDGVPAGRLSVVTALDKTNFWIAVRDQAIFAVDQETLHGTRIAEPEAGAFRTVQNIFADGNDIYVIAGAAGDFNDRGLENSLWRKRNGVWEKLISGLDSTGTSEQFAGRHWLFTREGLWLGAFGTGGWFVPRDGGEPQPIAWQTGSPFDSINRWFQLKNGQMLALQFGRGGMLADPALLTARTVKATSEILQLARPLLQTPDGKIFAIQRGNQSALSEWDGRQWQRHPFPDNLQLWSDCAIATDTRSRIWFIDQSYNPDPALRPTMIYDPAKGRFQRFSSFPSALQTQAAVLADTRLDGNQSSAAAFSSDGRIAYMDRTWEVHYFNGHEWRQWRLNDIVKGGYWGSSDHAPFFEAGGKLAISSNDKVWELDDLGGWKSTGQPAPKNPGDVAPTTGTPNVPEASSIVADRRGIYWVVARKQLYRAGYGLRAAVFPPNEPQPFADGRKLAGVIVDNFGNAFLQTRLGNREETVLVPACEPLPEIKIHPDEQTGDGVALEFSAPGVAQPRFVWRTDDGAWSAATTNTLVRFDELSAGKHRVEVLALDDRLQSSPSPAIWNFEVRSNPSDRIQRFIAQLGDPDFVRREEAITWLARHRALSLPALRAALEHETSSEKRWWLQAAIQQCQ